MALLVAAAKLPLNAFRLLLWACSSGRVCYAIYIYACALSKNACAPTILHTEGRHPTTFAAIPLYYSILSYTHRPHPSSGSPRTPSLHTPFITPRPPLLARHSSLPSCVCLHPSLHLTLFFQYHLFSHEKVFLRSGEYKQRAGCL